MHCVRTDENIDYTGVKMVHGQQPVSQATVNELINDLGSKDGIVRQKARAALVRIGPPALESVTRIFETKRHAYTHWEAAKAISAIGGPGAVTPLLHALGDDDFSIRWIAAEGLIALGGSILEPLAKFMAEEDFATFYCEAAHHVIHDLISRHIIDDETIAHVEPLKKSLEKSASSTEISLEASKLLQWLQSNAG